MCCGNISHWTHRSKTRWNLCFYGIGYACWNAHFRHFRWTSNWKELWQADIVLRQSSLLSNSLSYNCFSPLCNRQSCRSLGLFCSLLLVSSATEIFLQLRSKSKRQMPLDYVILDQCIDCHLPKKYCSLFGLPCTLYIFSHLVDPSSYENQIEFFIAQSLIKWDIEHISNTS